MIKAWRERGWSRVSKMDTQAAHNPNVPRGFRQMLVTCFTIWRVMLAEYRNTWFYHIFFGMLLPVGLAFLISRGSSLLDTGHAIYLLGGNMVISIVYGPTVMLITKIGWGKEFREIDYWVTLPVPKIAFIFAMTSVYLLFAAPGLLVAYVIGSWIFNLPLLGGILLPGVAVLGVLALSGFGALLGSVAKTGQVAGIYGNVFIAVATFLSPLMIPQEQIPALLRLIGLLLPTTYVAEVFRLALAGQVGPLFLRDVLLLIGFALFFFALVHYKFDWRER